MKLTVGDVEIESMASEELIRFLIQETEAETPREVELYLKWKGYWVEEHETHYYLKCGDPSAKITLGKARHLGSGDIVE